MFAARTAVELLRRGSDVDPDAGLVEVGNVNRTTSYLVLWGTMVYLTYSSY